MSLTECINRAVKAGLMDPARAAFARDMFKENFDQAKLGLGDAQALAVAREQTVTTIKHMMAQIRREKLLQVTRAQDILSRSTTAGVPLSRAMLAHLDFDPGVKGINNISKRKDTLRGVFHDKMGEFLRTHQRDLLGRVRDKEQLADIVRELHGESNGNAKAKEMAKAFADTAERARKMFNQAGGDIPPLKGWALPHSHDAIAVRAAGFDTWFQFIKERVDLSKMKDYSTGQPMTDFRFKVAAKEAFEGISTEGWAGREAGGGAFGQKLARRRQDHRFFVFKSADDWTAYHNKFGSGDVFSVMMGHFDGMARDIAALQILGPNPTATLRWMGDVVEKDLMVEAMRTGARTDAPESAARSTRRMIDGMWESYSGAQNAPINGRAARTFAGLRSVLQSAQLGGAALSAVTDLGFQKMAADQVGIPMRKILGRYVSLLTPGRKEDELLAVRLGLIADSWSSLAVAQQRYLGEVSGPEITSRLADFTMRVSGLSPWTQAGRWAFGMEFSGLLADNAGKAFANLPDPLRKTLEHHGISMFDWDLARRTPMLEHEGASFLRPEDIGDEEIAFKFLDMIHTETEYAIPSASLRGRSVILGESKPGTFVGEMIRSVAMYKNFTVTLMMTHHRRMMSMPTAGQKGKYAAQLMLTMTLMGGLSMQMKELAKGRDPRTMFDPSDKAATAKFWGAAALQGGGMGVFGDFLFSQQDRFGRGLAAAVAGPVVGVAADFTGYLNENVNRAIEGKDTKVASGAIDLAQRYAPGSSLWFMRTGIEAILNSTLREMADPQNNERLRRIEKRYKEDYGQEYWYQPSTGNLRAPNLGAAFGVN